MINLDTAPVYFKTELVTRITLYGLTPVPRLIQIRHNTSEVVKHCVPSWGLLVVSLARAWVRDPLRRLDLPIACGWYGVVTLFLIQAW